MNTVENKRLPFIVAVLGLLLAGCGSTSGLERSERMTNSMESVEENIGRTLEEVNSVERALNDLIRPGQQGIEEAYSEYSESVENLEEYSNRFFAELDDMDSYASTYFSEWQAENQEFESARLQDLAESRRSEVQSNYEDILVERDGIEEQLSQYVANNDELRSYLSNDLTAQGIETVTPLIEEVIEDSNRLRQRLASVQATVEDTRNGMSRRGRIAGN